MSEKLQKKKKPLGATREMTLSLHQKVLTQM